MEMSYPEPEEDSIYILSKGSNMDSNTQQKIYDIEININSILGFVKGWDIKFSKLGKKQYEYYKKNPTTIYSIIGNKNRGKSFLLSKIAKRKLPYGFSVTTKGLSISFPTYNNITLLDSVGFESPLLEIDGQEYMLKTENDEENKKFYKKINEIKIKIKELLSKKGNNVNEIRSEENEFFRERNNFRQKIKNKEEQIYSLTNERRMTDFFLQRFIIENANVVLLVVGKLSIDDQFFLNKLTKLIKDNNKVFLQKIIVIHNLMSMKEIKVVEDYISNTLKKSLTFTLVQKKDLQINDDNILKKIKKYNRFRYYEKDKESSEKDIVHLIMAQEGSEAGDYYNYSAIDYIRKIGSTVTNPQEFDLIERLKKYFCEVSETIIKFNEPNEKIVSDNIKLIEDKGDKGNAKLVLDYKKKITLEPFYGDLFVGTFGDPKFTPTYHIVSNDPDYLEIYLDCPGKTTVDEAKINYPDNQNTNTSIVIKGKREKEEYKTMGRKFSSGDFELKIILRGEDGEIKKKKIVEYLEGGFILIKIEKNKN